MRNKKNILLLLCTLWITWSHAYIASIYLGNYTNSNGKYGCWVWGQTNQSNHFVAQKLNPGTMKWTKIANVDSLKACIAIFQAAGGDLDNKVSGYILTEHPLVAPGTAPAGAANYQEPYLFTQESALACGKCDCSYYKSKYSQQICMPDTGYKNMYCGKNGCPTDGW